MLSLITEQSALDKISFLFLNHLMVSGGVPESSTLNWTFDPGNTFIDSGFSRMHGGSEKEKQQLLRKIHQKSFQFPFFFSAGRKLDKPIISDLLQER